MPDELNQYEFLVFGFDPAGQTVGARFAYNQYEEAAEAIIPHRLYITEAIHRDQQAFAAELPVAVVRQGEITQIPVIDRSVFINLLLASVGPEREPNIGCDPEQLRALRISNDFRLAMMAMRHKNINHNGRHDSYDSAKALD